MDLLRYTAWSSTPGNLAAKGPASPHTTRLCGLSGSAHGADRGGRSGADRAALKDWLHLIEQRKEHEQPQAAEKLRRLLWEPIAERLPPDTRTVYLAPDAGLSRLPWAALPGRKPGSILLEDHALALVPNGHFLLGRLRSEGRFGKGTARRWWWAASGRTCRGPNANSVCCRRCTATRRSPWMDKQLTSAEWSRNCRRRLVHLATHGFFNEKDFQHEKKRASEQTTALLASREILAGPAGLRITAGAKSPLAYTGLLLAGADRPEKAGPDGNILTGEAIASLDLGKLGWRC